MEAATLKEKNDEATGTMKAVRKADEADCKVESLTRGGFRMSWKEL
jgi:hypothetical protein